MQTLQGENEPSPDSGSQEANGGGGTPPRVLEPAAWWKRVLVSLAGPLGNIVLAFLIALLLYAAPPVGIAPGLDLGGAVIGRVRAGSDAELAGLRAGDQVLSAGGRRVSTWDELVTENHLASGSEFRQIDLVVSNRMDGSVRTLEVPLSRQEHASHFGVAGIESVLICSFGDVMPGTPAAVAGLLPQDLAVATDGVPLYGSEMFVERIQATEGRPIRIRVLRQQDLLDLVVSPVRSEEDGRWQIGVRIGDLDPKVPMWMQYRRPMLQLKGDFRAVGRVLRALVAPSRKGESRRVAGALSGPIVILATMWLSTLANLLHTVGFVRFLNVNLALINLLPLPVLDGGHIVFALYEGITRRKVNPKLLSVLVNGFAILLLLLFVVISVRDTWILSRLFGRPREVPSLSGAPEVGGAGEPRTPRGMEGADAEP